MDNFPYIYNERLLQSSSNNGYSIDHPINRIKNYATIDEVHHVSTETTSPNYVTSIPVELSMSVQGRYFLGMAEDVSFGEATNGWARLYNPLDSGVNMFVNVWTVSDIISSPTRVQVWFNSTPPGIIQDSETVTSANTAIVPVPQPKVKLQYAIGVKGFPTGGVKAFGRSAPEGETINSEENGKYIFPPGGSFLVFLSNPSTPTKPARGRIAFGWWEEPIQQ